ncbi:MAG: hypothetical protein AAFX90_22240 [Pseudomonadota bacterium]
MFDVLKVSAIAVFIGLLTGCAATSVTPISKNQVLISTSAAPACGTDGAAKVASQMAAVATLRAGYQRYVIQGGGVQNNTRVVSTGPTFATTYGSASVYGNTAYGSSTTYFGGSTSYLAGSNNAEFAVLMLNPGDRGYANGLDAKAALGKEWEAKVRDGINTCG